MRFDDRFLEDVRSRLNISDVVGRRVTWDRKKSQASRGDYWACCPFHNEKSPSFHADDRRQRYHCFGCGASGDIFRFVTETEGVSFPEAVERLAGEAGLALPERDPEAEKRAEKRGTLYDVMALAQAYFADALQSAAGADARRYVRDRHLSGDIQARFGLGFAPDSRNGLKNYLANKGVPADDMAEAGLVIAGPDIPVSYDRFRNRVMFPIHDNRGRIIAFGGRALSADQPAKYLNSPETPLFSKSHVLYNLHRAREPVHQGATLMAVEGYMDVIACAAHGIDGVVAPLGTALTEDQLRLMWRIKDSPVLCFDGDTAGFKAAARAAELALGQLKPGKTVRFALLPQGQDPDDLLNAKGRDALDRLIKTAKPLSDMLWLKETEGAVLDTPERKAAFEQRIKALVRLIEDPTVRRHYDQEFRDRLSALAGPATYPTQQGQNRGKARLANGRGAFTISRSLSQNRLVTGLSADNGMAVSPRDAALVMTVINHPSLLDRHDETFSSLEFQNGEITKLHQALLAILGDDPELNRDGIRVGLATRGYEALLNRLDAILAACRLWQTRPGADPLDAEQGWMQAVQLHERVAGLQIEKQAAQQALENDPNEMNFNRLVAVQNAITRVDQTEALIEGFGALSGL